MLLDKFVELSEEALIAGDPVYRISTYDYNKLKLFFLSVLYRASISTQQFYDKIKLRPYEDVFREMILSGNSDKNNDYPVILTRFTDDYGKYSLRGPVTQRVPGFGINTCRFHLPPFIALIKVDQRPLSPELSKFALTENKPLDIIAVNSTETGDLRQLVKLFMDNPHNS